MSAAIRHIQHERMSRIAFHMGEALLRVASDYPTIMEVVLEQVQNSLDAGATAIGIVLNRKTRNIAIRDNGAGFSEAQFEAALLQVCHSQKTENQLGEFGIGLISPLGKCEYSTITSFDPETSIAHTWTLNTDEIRKQQDTVSVPCHRRDELRYSKQGTPGKETVSWRTQVEIFRYTPDRLISRIANIATLRNAILEKYSEAMRRNKTSISIRFVGEDGKVAIEEGITAKEFSGKALPVVVINDTDAGEVTFTLYLSPETPEGRKGKVLFGVTGRDYRFGANFFAVSAQGLLDRAIIRDLLSGVFEGTITAERVTLRSERKAFERNDAMTGLCVAIAEWHEKHGAQYMEQIRTQAEDERYQTLGLESLRTLAAMFKLPQFADLQSILQGFPVEIPEGKHEPANDVPAIEIVRDQKEDDDTDETKPKKRGASSSSTKLTVSGPRGKRGTPVSHANGLRYSHIPMDGSDRLWVLDPAKGILFFNISHPEWALCTQSDQKLRRLMETATVHALLIQAMPQDLHDTLRFAFDHELGMLMHLFRNSGAFNPLLSNKVALDAEVSG